MTALLQTLIDRHIFKHDALELANDIIASMGKQKKNNIPKSMLFPKSASTTSESGTEERHYRQPQRFRHVHKLLTCTITNVSSLKP